MERGLHPTIILLTLTVFFITTGKAQAQGIQLSKANVWLSTKDGSKQLSKEADIAIQELKDLNSNKIINIDNEKTFQTIDGMGSSLEHATCFNLSKLDSVEREKTLTALLTDEVGINMNLMRICMGTPDFTSDLWYSYSDLPNGEVDTLLKTFSIKKDETYILPVLRQALRIRPDLRFFASPWSPPGWMKTSGSMIGGSVKPEYYASLARYFVKFIKAYEAAGVPVFAVTVQNEPGVDRQFESPKWHYPSCHWTAEAQRDFIKNYLGPEFVRNGLKTEIWCYDHNFNMKPVTDGSLTFIPEKPGDAGIGFPRTILSDPKAMEYTSAMAFHGYVGSPDGMSQIQKEFPHVPVRFTEGSVFGLSGGIQLMNILKNSAISYNAWVIMLDQNRKPNNGPFAASQTIIERDLKNNRAIYYFDYYMYGHFMKFITPGSKIISSTAHGTSIRHLASINPEGKLVVILINNSGNKEAAYVVCQNRYVEIKMPENSIATLILD
ncbi:MAG: glycoside hydrolase family 30 protein [Bacteroidetes bacterium]|nr:glycoside hydrolase family 30 protein [Bacteroidota bacterium]